MHHNLGSPIDFSILATPATPYSQLIRRSFSTGNPDSLPDAQIGLFYTGIVGTQLYATVAKKNRLPSLKDRYSQRLGTYIENPDLEAEQAINYEIGFKSDLSPKTHIEAAIFYSDIEDKIQTVENVVDDRSQMQNVGKVNMTALEFGLKFQPASWWTGWQLHVSIYGK